MADISKNLPANHLPPDLVAPFRRTIGPAVSSMEAARLSTLPVPQIRKELVTLQLKQGAPLTKDECDAGLLMLALAGLPRAAVEDEDIEKVRALYLELLREAGVTGLMLRSACTRYIMRPSNGKPKYFPDPGQLAELCADDIADRRNALLALNGALTLINAPSQPSEEQDLVTIDRMRQIRAAAEGKRVSSHRAPGGTMARPTMTTDEILATRNPVAVAKLRATRPIVTEEKDL